MRLTKEQLIEHDKLVQLIDDMKSAAYRRGTKEMERLRNKLYVDIAYLCSQIRSGACEWSFDEDSYSWDSACGQKWGFNDGGPKENGVNFCQNCGKALTIAEQEEDRHA